MNPLACTILQKKHYDSLHFALLQIKGSRRFGGKKPNSNLLFLVLGATSTNDLTITNYDFKTRRDN